MSLDETQIKPGAPAGCSTEQSLAPLKSDVEPAAYQRAPTLMAGASAGSQGQVRVWAPSRRLLWGVATGTGLGSLLLIIMLNFITRGFGPLCGSFAWVFVAFFVSVAALRRPCYLTTDDAGIGITTRKGSRTLQWSDISTVEATLQASMYDHNKIVLKAPDSVEINLTGYPAQVRHEILNLIVQRAGLKAANSGHFLRLYVRRGDPALYEPLTPSALNPGDGGR